MDQEGLPDYWGIETSAPGTGLSLIGTTIRKDYPTTGVLKHALRLDLLHFLVQIRKDYPTTGVLKLVRPTTSPIAIGFSIRKDYPTTGVLKLGVENDREPFIL